MLAVFILAYLGENRAPVAATTVPVRYSPLTEPEAARPEPPPVLVPTGPTERERQLEQRVAALQQEMEQLRQRLKTLGDENSDLIDRLANLNLAKPATPATPMKAEPPPPADVPDDYVSLGAELLALRELENLPMPTVTASQADVEKVILRWLKRQFPKDYGEREGSAFAALGAIPRPLDTLPLRAALLVRQLGGWWDDEKSTIYLVDPKDQPDGQPVLSDPILGLAQGTLLHHYQKTLMPAAGLASLSTDERLARLGLLGGDAALIRFLYDLRQSRVPRTGDLPADDPDHPLNQVPMPAYLRELEVFPLAIGFQFAQSLHSVGGFEQLSSAYSRVPESTADVLDTERYLDEQRLAVPKLEWKDTKIASTAPFWDDRLGQQATLVFLKRYNDAEAAHTAARGWVSDRFAAYAVQGDRNRRGHAVWQSRWVTPEQAKVFHKAMAECLRQFYDREDASDTFSKDGRHLRLRLQEAENSVVMIDAASEAFAKAALANFGLK